MYGYPALETYEVAHTLGHSAASYNGGMRLTAKVIVVLGLCAGGCSPAENSRSSSTDLPTGNETVVLEVEHRTRWRELRLEGTTNLPDGAVVTYILTHALANELPPGEWPAQNLIANGTAAVETGKYWAQFNTTYWPPGKVDIQVQFPVAPQPDTVRERYGEFGEQLLGSNVISLGASNVVSTEHSFDWTR